MTLGRVVVVGASQAGAAAVRELRAAGYEQELVLLDPDPAAPFRRPEVSKGLLSGKYSREAVTASVPLGIDRRIEAAATGLDPARRRLAYDGGELEYDGLVIATGSRPRPWPTAVPAGVHLLHGIEDAERMRAELAAASRLVIVGGGFIGLEAAAVAARLGKEVTVLEAAPVVLERVLGAELGAHMGALHSGNGVQVRTSVAVDGFEADAQGRLSGVRLGDGELVSADVALVAIGQLPEVDWLAGSGLPIDGGILCDETTAVLGHEGIVAAGDLASWVNPLYGRRMRIEHWQHAIQHGVYAARRLLGRHDPAGFGTVPYFWSDQYDGKLQAVGAIAGSEQSEVFHRDGDIIAAGYAREGRITAFVAYGLGPVVLKLADIVRAQGALDTSIAAAASIIEAAQRKATSLVAEGVSS